MCSRSCLLKLCLRSDRNVPQDLPKRRRDFQKRLWSRLIGFVDAPARPCIQNNKKQVVSSLILIGKTAELITFSEQECRKSVCQPAKETKRLRIYCGFGHNLLFFVCLWPQHKLNAVQKVGEECAQQKVEFGRKPKKTIVIFHRL